MSKDDGGPAFPTNLEDWNGGFGGMKRDWFAGMAMQGFCARHPDNDVGQDETAKLAYEQADAMLAEGNKKQASEVQDES